MQAALTFEKSSLTLEATQMIIAAGIAKAEELGVPAAIAVVDEGGATKAFARMDGAGLIATDVAMAKAYTAAATGVPTATFHEFIKMDQAAELSMPHLPRITAVAGGIPIGTENGPAAGAVGVSGGPVDVDMQIAEAAVAAAP
jgi:uncharacterized protein GlcG (DUF336 family)